MDLQITINLLLMVQGVQLIDICRSVTIATPRNQSTKATGLGRLMGT